MLKENLNEYEMKMKSFDEVLFYRKLKTLSIQCKYEVVKIPILKAYEGNQGRVRENVSTPDFSFNYKDRKIVVEVKGFLHGGDKAMFYYKRVAYECHKKGIEFYMVQYVKNKLVKQKDFYLWGDKGRAKLGNNVPTFWERANIS